MYEMKTKKDVFLMRDSKLSRLVEKAETFLCEIGQKEDEVYICKTANGSNFFTLTFADCRVAVRHFFIAALGGESGTIVFSNLSKETVCNLYLKLPDIKT